MIRGDGKDAPVERLVEEFRARRRAGGRTIVRAVDVVQAVQVAEALRGSGDAQWFRGQVADWPKLAPTFHRLREQETDVARERLAHFSQWAKATPGLDELAADDDKLIAVAQHYGIATTFLDFTTEPRVAGFFASDGGPPPDGLDSCIVCLNLEEARDIWGSTGRALEQPSPELLEIDVANLWRLEAQHGTFVWCPYDTLDGPYPLDRIVFPYTGPYEVPPATIYPERASPLERLIDQYFQEEQIRAGTRFLHEYLVEPLGMNVLDTGAKPYIAESFSTTPSPHPSWAPAVIADWLKVDREYWEHTAAGPIRTLVVDTRADPHESGARVKEDVTSALAETAGLRSAAPRWTVETVEGTGEMIDVLERALGRVWDGMARLPYADEQLATAMGGVAAFAVAYFAAGERAAAAKRLLAQPFKVELGGGGENVHAFAWVDENSLRAAVRDDFAALLVPDVRERIFALTFNILMTARTPSLLFDYLKLVDLFATELIPTQATLDAGNPMICSPARLDVLGPA
jgi:hypothetical protein